MTRPLSYDPQYGYMFQIFTRSTEKTWEHCDYAKDKTEKNYLLNEYKLAYGRGFEFKVVEFPKKYHCAIANNQINVS